MRYFMNYYGCRKNENHEKKHFIKVILQIKIHHVLGSPQTIYLSFQREQRVQRAWGEQQYPQLNNNNEVIWIFVGGSFPRRTNCRISMETAMKWYSAADAFFTSSQTTSPSIVTPTTRLPFWFAIDCDNNPYSVQTSHHLASCMRPPHQHLTMTTTLLAKVISHLPLELIPPTRNDYNIINIYENDNKN